MFFSSRSMYRNWWQAFARCSSLYHPGSNHTEFSKWKQKYSTLSFFPVTSDGKMSLVHQWVSQRLSQNKIGKGRAYTACGPFPPLLRRTQCRYILESLGAIRSAKDWGPWHPGIFPKHLEGRFRCEPGNHIGVSKNSGTPKWMVYNGKPF